jgi:tetratricopeptide (TPR) repeat protein
MAAVAWQKRAVVALIIYIIYCGFHPLVFAGQGSVAVAADELAERGEQLRRNANASGAAEAFRRALDFQPSNLRALLGLARLSRAELDYSAAVRFVDHALKSHPDSAAALIEYAHIYLAAEDAGRARIFLDRALRLDPQSEAANTGLAEADLLDRNYEPARARLSIWLASNPPSARARTVLARALLELNRIAEAGVQAGRAIELDPYDAEAHHTLAFIKASERNADEARTLARRAVSLDPFNAAARRLFSQYIDGQAGYRQEVSGAALKHYERGREFKRQGRAAEAIGALEAALALEPGYYRALVALSDIRLRQREWMLAARAARAAIEIDPEGAIAHMELSYAHRGRQEQSRIDIGAADFEAAFYAGRAPSGPGLTSEIFPDYTPLAKREQIVIDRAVAPLARFLPALSRKGARHHLLGYDERASDIRGLASIAEGKTFDGRFYASIRGVGGRITVSGIEYIDMAARGGFHTIAHEFAHQVHMIAMEKEERRAISRLFERARREGRVLDYYAAANEYEYFAQGYEAYVSERKRPSAGVTARHTRQELMARDPDLYRFIAVLAGESHAETGRANKASSGYNLTSYATACDYENGVFPCAAVSNSNCCASILELRQFHSTM